MGRSVMKPFARNVRFKNGAWRYRVPRWVDDATLCRVFGCKREVTLGEGLGEAAARYGELMKALHIVHTGRTLKELFDRFTAEEIPTRKPATQRQYTAGIRNLRPIFGHMPPGDFKTTYAFQYLDRHKDRYRSATHDIETLGAVFTAAIRWGYLEAREHPLRGMRIKQGLKARTRSPSMEEIGEFLKVTNPMLRAYVVLKLATGPRKADMLRLKLTDAKADGIHVVHQKTGKTTIYKWTDERRAAWEACKAARPKRVANMTYLFCTRQGQPYVTDDGMTQGFNSIWQRAIAKAVAAGVERFTEHDLRRTVADAAITLEQARGLLGHSSATMTAKVYRTRPEEV